MRMFVLRHMTFIVMDLATLCCSQFLAVHVRVSNMPAMNVATLAVLSPFAPRHSGGSPVRGVFQCGRAAGALFLAVSSCIPATFTSWTTVTLRTLDDHLSVKWFYVEGLFEFLVLLLAPRRALFDQLMPFRFLRRFHHE